MPIDRCPPSVDDLAQQLAARVACGGRQFQPAFVLPKDPARQLRSYRTCWLPAEQTPLLAPPRANGAYVPELSAALYKDRNLIDGARCCASILAQYTHARDRTGRTAEITVTYLMKAMGKSRRTVQRYLRQLERAGYITVDVLHARTRMCAGLLVTLLSTLLPRHGWPEKAMKPAMPRLSLNNSFRYKTRTIPRVLWAIRCTKPIEKAWDAMRLPLAAFPGLF